VKERKDRREKRAGMRYRREGMGEYPESRKA
jgi:hypothetical protein